MRDDFLRYDGLKKENAPKLQKTKVDELMLALDLDTGPDDLEVLDEAGGSPDWYLDDFDPDFDSVEPDIAEVVYLDGIPSSGVMK